LPIIYLADFALITKSLNKKVEDAKVDSDSRRYGFDNKLQQGKEFPVILIKRLSQKW
jgi:hypothetical protein